MADANSSDSPLDALAGAADPDTLEGFKLLGNETRLAILLALWESMDPEQPRTEQTMQFSELRDRVGISDSGQFNYHLNELAGRFIEQSDAGYILTRPAENILRVIFAGTMSKSKSFENEPIDGRCTICGSSIVIDYDDNMLLYRCTNCEGRYDLPGDPSGALSKTYRPPAGLIDRSPEEFHRKGVVWGRNKVLTTLKGVCPTCSGSVTANVHICEQHATDGESVCEHCKSIWKIRWLHICDICKLGHWNPAHAPAFTELAVNAFYHAHGMDPDQLFKESAKDELYETIVERTVESKRPLQLRIGFEIDDDRLDVILDEDARVTSVS